MKLFMFCFLLAVMVLAPSQGQCENWKEFFKDGNGVWQYDKDSIHYPKQKKTLFGLTVRNKEIVNVWVRYEKSGSGQMTRIYCAERECDNCGFSFGSVNPWIESEKISVERESIKPGSWGEGLLKKVCP